MMGTASQKNANFIDININESCEHEEVFIEKACCSGPNIECACAGKSEVVCQNPDCSGIDDLDASILFDVMHGGGSDCE